jgi:hypothetical protein
VWRQQHGHAACDYTRHGGRCKMASAGNGDLNISRIYAQLSRGPLKGCKGRVNSGRTEEELGARQTRQRARLGRRGPVCGASSFGRSTSGSLAMLAAMRRASSRVSGLAAARRPGSSSK